LETGNENAPGKPNWRGDLFLALLAFAVIGAGTTRLRRNFHPLRNSPNIAVRIVRPHRNRSPHGKRHSVCHLVLPVIWESRSESDSLRIGINPHSPYSSVPGSGLYLCACNSIPWIVAPGPFTIIAVQVIKEVVEAIENNP
jgi:hypothetical protein